MADDPMILVRYFAGARAAAGVPEEKVPATTLEAVIDTISRAHGERLATVLAASSFLVDGLASHDRSATLPAGTHGRRAATVRRRLSNRQAAANPRAADEHWPAGDRACVGLRRTVCRHDLHDP